MRYSGSCPDFHSKEGGSLEMFWWGEGRRGGGERGREGREGKERGDRKDRKRERRGGGSKSLGFGPPNDSIKGISFHTH